MVRFVALTWGGGGSRSHPEEDLQILAEVPPKVSVYCCLHLIHDELFMCSLAPPTLICKQPHEDVRPVKARKGPHMASKIHLLTIHTREDPGGSSTLTPDL